jgi:hypothetical protein
LSGWQAHVASLLPPPSPHVLTSAAASHPQTASPPPQHHKLETSHLPSTSTPSRDLPGHRSLCARPRPWRVAQADLQAEGGEWVSRYRASQRSYILSSSQVCRQRTRRTATLAAWPWKMASWFASTSNSCSHTACRDALNRLFIHLCHDALAARLLIFPIGPVTRLRVTLHVLTRVPRTTI